MSWNLLSDGALTSVDLYHCCCWRQVCQTNMNLFRSPCMLVVRVHMDCQIYCSCSRYVWPDGIFSVSWSGCAYYFHQCMQVLTLLQELSLTHCPSVWSSNLWIQFWWSPNSFTGYHDQETNIAISSWAPTSIMNNYWSLTNGRRRSAQNGMLIPAFQQTCQL